MSFQHSDYSSAIVRIKIVWYYSGEGNPRPMVVSSASAGRRWPNVTGSCKKSKEESTVKSIQPRILVFLVAAFISFLFSVGLWFFVDKDAGLYVGLWVPSILALAAVLKETR